MAFHLQAGMTLWIVNDYSEARAPVTTSKRDRLQFGYLFAGLSSLWLSLAIVLLYGLSKTILKPSDEVVEDFEVLYLLLLRLPPVGAPSLLQRLGQDGVVVLAGPKVVEYLSHKVQIIYIE